MPRTTTLASALTGPTGGHVETVVAAVGVGLAVVCVVLGLVFAVVRRGRPLALVASGVVALIGTALVLSFV